MTPTATSPDDRIGPDPATPDGPGRARGPHGTWPLIGRRGELGRIASALRREPSSGVALTGEAGMGKSRLASEALDLAEQIGFTARRAVASRAAAGIPLGALAPFLPVMPPGSVQGDLLRWAAATIVGAVDGPLLLAIDDAHLLDDASATVVQQLATEAQAFVVLTVRTGEPCPDAISALWKTGGVDRIEVGPLTLPEIESMLQQVLGRAIDGGTMHALWTASHGNPLYLREAVLGAIDDGTLVEAGDVWRLTGPLGANQRLAELVEDRLAGLARRERTILEVLAVGEPLGPDLLRAAGLDVSDTVLSRLEDRGLLTVRLDGKRRVVRLAHPLHGEVLRTRMSSIRSIEANRALADAVEALGARRREDVLRVAVWRLDGGGDLDPALMLEAARRAAFALDHPLAERLARAARDAGAGIGAGFVLAEVLMHQGKVVEGDRVLAALQKEATTDEERALAGMSRSSLQFWALGLVDAALEVLTDAEAQVAPGGWRNELVGVRAVTTMLAGRPRDAIALATPIVEADTSRALIQASIAAGTSLAMAGRTTDALAVIDRGLAQHEALGEQTMLTRPYILENARATALFERGDLPGALALADDGYRASVAGRDAAAQAWFAMILGKVHLMTGHLTTADRLFAEGANLYADLHHMGPRRWCLSGRVIANAWLGRPRLVRSVMDELAATPSPMHFLEGEVYRARAWAEWSHGQPERARELLREGVAYAREQGLGALVLSALHDLARLGAVAEAAKDMAEVAADVDGDLAPLRAAFADALHRQDGDDLDRCAVGFEAMGALLPAAEASAYAATAHVQRQRRRLAALSERNASRLLDGCDRVRTPALASLGRSTDLTGRQLEIARLAASGLSSKTIAQRLGLSPRTVDNHLQRVYQRLGVSSRDDLVDALDDATSGGGGI